MSSQIAQVDGCTFTTEELQRFHQYYKYPWAAAGLGDAPLSGRIEHFAAHIDPATDKARLRAWLRTMGVVDQDELSEEAKLYACFDEFDFAAAPGFNELLAQVYDTDDVSRVEIGERMDRAKAEYYARNVEPQLDYAQYRRFREENEPKPVCPYQHMWESDDGQKDAPDTAKFAHVKTVDIAHALSGADSVLTLEALNRLLDEVRAAHGEEHYAAAVINSHCNSDSGVDASVFLPGLDVQGGDAVLQAAVQLQVELRRLNSTKPVVIFANGSVDPSALGVILSTVDVVTSEKFSVDVSPTSVGARQFPLAALHDWAHLSERQGDRAPPGTAEYILCHPDLVLRSGEWAALGLGIGFVAHRKFAAATEQALLAASCPPPHTRGALRKACAVESAYPGPSKIGVWAREIGEFFAPLAAAGTAIGSLVGALREIDRPWAQKYLAFSTDATSMAVAEARIAGLQSMRGLEYSKGLALELAAAAAWTRGAVDPGDLFARKNTETFANSDDKSTDAHIPPSPAAAQLLAEAPGECPFARMYRKNPERFKNVDLKAIAKHRSLGL
ncbi:hypothetical protein GGF46_004126 [Coemansia sp. RSA 552]|nr:hypothetical protein GGF46_004126 [Coemansia sp. RSA 552]